MRSVWEGIQQKKKVAKINKPSEKSINWIKEWQYYFLMAAYKLTIHLSWNI